MKLYFLVGIVVIVLALLVILSPGQVNEEGELTTLATLDVNVLLSDNLVQEEAEDVESSLAIYTVFVYDGDFSPSVMYVNLGDTVKLTFATGREHEDVEDVEVLYDFNLPHFGIATVVDTAQEIEFVADEVGEFEYFCMTCSPQAYGVLVVN